MRFWACVGDISLWLASIVLSGIILGSIVSFFVWVPVASSTGAIIFRALISLVVLFVSICLLALCVKKLD